MTIYEPVTEYGKMIASLLKYDDQVRLDIHEYLEKAEPEWTQLKQSNISLDFLVKVAEKKQFEAEQKLRAIKQVLEESCSKCILLYHGESCSKRTCEFKTMREILEAGL